MRSMIRSAAVAIDGLRHYTIVRPNSIGRRYDLNQAIPRQLFPPQQQHPNTQEGEEEQEQE